MELNLQFNAGVYLSAIKPVLETVDVGWSADIGDWVLTCAKVSDRKDNLDEHLLCTQIALIVKSKQDDLISHKVTLHCYHTNDKIQVQGTSIMAPGVSSATWTARNLIEPLAVSHVSTNQASIDHINSAILTASSNSCQACFSHINPRPTSVREQPIACRKCGNTFHKRCTDRRRNRGANWNKEPWFCYSCVLDKTEDQNITNGINRRATDALENVPVPKRAAPHVEDQAIIDITDEPPIRTLNPSAGEF